MWKLRPFDKGQTSTEPAYPYRQPRSVVRRPPSVPPNRRHLVNRREYLDDTDSLRAAYRESETLFAQLQAFRSSIDGESSVQEDIVGYDDGAPF